MMLRMIRGFYNYWHGQGVQVGITGGGSSLIPDSSQDTQVDMRYGSPALEYIADYYDFIFAYNYTKDLSGLNGLKYYLNELDTVYPNQKMFWILTRSWGDSSGNPTWTIEPEAVALEMKNCLDRNYVITTYQDTLNDGTPPYTLSQWWSYMQTACALYDANAPYYEQVVYGTNMLTGVTGYTYGWVTNSTT